MTSRLGRLAPTRDLAVLSAVFFLIFAGTGSLQQYLVPYLEEHAGWSATWAPWSLATLYLSMIVWRLLAVYTIRRIGDYGSIALGALTYTLFPVAIIVSPTRPVVLVAAVLWGWGAASFWLASGSQVLDTAREAHYGRASGIFYTATHLGMVCGLFTLGQCYRARPDSPAFLWIAFAAAALGNALCLAVPRRRLPRDPPQLRAVLRVAFGRVGRVIAVPLVASAVGYGLLLGIFAEIVGKRFGLGFMFAITVSFYIMRAFISLVSGALSDRIGTRRVLVLAFAASGIALVWPAFAQGAAPLVVAAGALGLLASAVPVGITALVGETASSGSRQAALAGLHVWRDMGVAVGLIGAAQLRAAFGGFREPFLAFAVIFVVCGLIAARLPEVGSARAREPAER